MCTHFKGFIAALRFTVVDLWFSRGDCQHHRGANLLVYIIFAEKQYENEKFWTERERYPSRP